LIAAEAHASRIAPSEVRVRVDAALELGRTVLSSASINATRHNAHARRLA
jgi:hypothetical protein